jgi:DNA-binding NarL/FixJ family response regulator
VSATLRTTETYRSPGAMSVGQGGAQLDSGMPAVRLGHVDTVGVHHLTPRQAEVLRLLARGWTDAQIADELFLSRRTVHAHLREIFRKLGVSHRSAATRYAIEHGLA